MLIKTRRQDQDEAVKASRVILAGNSLAQPDLTTAEEDKKPVRVFRLGLQILLAWNLRSFATLHRNAMATTRPSTRPSPLLPWTPSSASCSPPFPSTSCRAKMTLPHRPCRNSLCTQLCYRRRMDSRITRAGRTLGGVKLEGLGEFAGGGSRRELTWRM